MRPSPFPLLAAALFASSLLPACQNDYERADASYETASYDASLEMQQETAPATIAPAPTLAPPAGRRAPVLLRRAELSMRVDDYAETAAALPALVGQFDAYLAGERERRDAYRVSNTYTVRVAAAEFDALLAAVAALAEEVEARTVTVDDVTEEFVDLEARLRARRAVEDRYVALLGRADKVTDVIAVQQQLAQVREEIERAEGRMRYLTDRATMSTVEVTLYETTPAGLAGGPSFFHRLGDAFGGGWRGLLALVVGAVAVWPLWIVLGLGAWAYGRWRRRAPAGQARAAS